ncbi:hypothetical protein [Roseisolibacter agri]|uniref:Uncharacterized protein n=1 Tax=Roseisolibacter agri TaxID=2014610 RepID=A0AA37Q852_9BACT|nr:hypothetical protein [Roseisolibacter agri]GLC28029.1 hypothetical protein rosag_45420 [Roseisolibacter agri]
MSGLKARRRRAALVGTLAAHTLLVGCYAHVPAAPGSVAPGARVRVGLTDAGVGALASSLGSSVRGLEGQVERVAGDTLVLRPDRLLTTADVDVAWSGDALALPAAWRQGVERRQLAKGRTAVLVGGGVALVVALVAVLRKAGEGAGGPGGGGPTPF